VKPYRPPPTRSHLVESGCGARSNSPLSEKFRETQLSNYMGTSFLGSQVLQAHPLYAWSPWIWLILLRVLTRSTESKSSRPIYAPKRKARSRERRAPLHRFSSGGAFPESFQVSEVAVISSRSSRTTGAVAAVHPRFRRWRRRSRPGPRLTEIFPQPQKSGGAPSRVGTKSFFHCHIRMHWDP
jgi:hypothetical protein